MPEVGVPAVAIVDPVFYAAGEVEAADYVVLLTPYREFCDPRTESMSACSWTRAIVLAGGDDARVWWIGMVSAV